MGTLIQILVDTDALPSGLGGNGKLVNICSHGCKNIHGLSHQWCPVYLQGLGCLAGADPQSAC